MKQFFFQYPKYGPGGSITTGPKRIIEGAQSQWTVTEEQIKTVGLDVQKVKNGDYAFSMPKEKAEHLRRIAAKW